MKLKLWWILVVVVLAFMVAGTVYAAATFGAVTGPTKLNPGYRFTVPVTQLTNPDKSICLAYSVNSVAQPAVLCTCAGTNCPGGANATYTCNIVSNSSNAVISWDISSYTANSGCTGKSVQGPAGSFTTGPTAVSLASFNATAQPASWVLLIGVAVLASTALLAIRWRRAH